MEIWPILTQWFWIRRFFKDPTPFLHFCNYLPFEEDLALNLNNSDFTLPKDDLCQIWLKLACLFWRRRFFFNVNICKYSFPYCGSSRPPGIMMLTILNLHYIRKLSCKYDLFWLSGSGEEDFSMTPPHFCNYLPFEKDLALYLIYAKFDWNWPAGFGEDCFSIETCKNGFPCCGPFRPPRTMMWTISESTLYQTAFM